MIICLQDKKGYEWFENEGCFFRGYIQLQDGTVLRKEAAICHLLNEYNGDLKQLAVNLKTVFGCYSFILDYKGTIIAGTDIARSMPLYYSIDYEYISDSSEIIREKMKINKDDIDYFRAAEMFDTTYIVGENTIYKNIKQLELGTIAKFNNTNKEIVHYYIHNNSIIDTQTDQGIRTLDTISEKAFSRTKAAIGNRQVVISLSGGYDSRYVACNLKRMGIQNVVCYSYGRKGSFEIAQSEKVAKALGYKWVCYQYTDEEIRSLLDDDTEPFFEYCNGHDYTIYLQNFIAVRNLIKDKAIDEDAVFITGLCNDMPTGFYVPDESAVEKYGISKTGCARFIIDDRFVRFKLSEDAEKVFIQEIVDKFDEYGLAIDDYGSFYNAVSCLFTGYNHSRCFLNMNRCHEYYGHEWLIPCWDRELLDFWYSVPLNLRYKQKLYEEYICMHLADKYGIGTKKYLNVEGTSFYKKVIKRKVGGLIARVSYPLGIPLRRKRDINNFAPFEVLLYKNIKQKRALKPERAGLALLLTCYVMEQRYGDNWFIKISSYYKK